MNDQAHNFLLAREKLLRVAVIARRAFSHWKTGFVVSVVIVGLALCYALLMKRKYLSESVLLYRQIIDARYFGNADDHVVTSKSVGNSLREYILARQNIKEVIDEFGLYPSTLAKQGYVAAEDEFRKNLTFKISEGDTFHISFIGPTPEQAQQVVARLSQMVIDRDVEMRKEQATITVSFLDAERKRVQDEWQRLEKELAQFIAAHPEFALVTDAQQGTPMVGASVRARAAKGGNKHIDPTLLALRRQASRIRSKMNAPAQPVTIEIDPQLIQAKEEAESDLRRAQQDLAQKRLQFTDMHPDVTAAKARIKPAQDRLNHIKQMIRSAQKAQKKPITVNPEVLKGELDTIERRIRVLKSGKAGVSKSVRDEASRIVALETEWNQLNLKVAEAREQYIQLENRQFRAGLTASSEVGGHASQINIIDPGFLPKRPVGVGRTQVVIGGMVVALIISGLWMISLAWFDDRMFDRVDLEALRLAPVLVVVPKYKAKRARASRIVRLEG